MFLFKKKKDRVDLQTMVWSAEVDERSQKGDICLPNHCFIEESAVTTSCGKVIIGNPDLFRVKEIAVLKIFCHTRAGCCCSKHEDQWYSDTGSNENKNKND